MWEVVLLQEGKCDGERLGMNYIFDLDGTLWDATAMAADIWNDVFADQKIGLRLDGQRVRLLMGKTMDEIGAALFPEMMPSEQHQIMDLCGRAEIEKMNRKQGILFDGAEDVLRSSEGHSYIVSNCQRGYITGFIRCFGFQRYIADYEESGRTGLGKAENIRLLMQRNGMENAIYIGDTEGDEQAAQQAGIPFIFASYGFGQAKNPDAVIERLSDLFDMGFPSFLGFSSSERTIYDGKKPTKRL